MLSHRKTERMIKLGIVSRTPTAQKDRCTVDGRPEPPNNTAMHKPLMFHSCLISVQETHENKARAWCLDLTAASPTKTSKKDKQITGWSKENKKKKKKKEKMMTRWQNKQSKGILYQKKKNKRQDKANKEKKLGICTSSCKQWLVYFEV